MQFGDEEAPIVNPVDVGISAKLIGKTNTQNKESQVQKQEKFSEFLKTEKLRKYKRMPRVFNQRNPVDMKCPSCGKERETRRRAGVKGGAKNFKRCDGQSVEGDVELKGTGIDQMQR